MVADGDVHRARCSSTSETLIQHPHRVAQQLPDHAGMVFERGQRELRDLVKARQLQDVAVVEGPSDDVEKKENDDQRQQDEEHHGPQAGLSWTCKLSRVKCVSDCGATEYEETSTDRCVPLEEKGTGILVSGR